MNKREFYDKLHQELSVKYQKYFLAPDHIETIRGAILGSGYSLEALITILQEKLTYPIKDKRKTRYLSILAFFSKANPSELEDILQKTQFDK